jgi:hypothetical protein
VEAFKLYSACQGTESIEAFVLDVTEAFWQIPLSPKERRFFAAKLRIDGRKWKVARMSPRKYGDKQQIDHTSSDDSFKPTVIKLVAEPLPAND